jgi:ATP-dependent exoDNAse (exonuclease V) beta subunit
MDVEMQSDAGADAGTAESAACVTLGRGVATEECAALARAHPHPRDKGIAFEEEEHKYFRVSADGVVSTTPFGLSVTGLLHKVDPKPFVEEEALAAIRNAYTPNPKYAGMSDAEILESWKAANRDGTTLHGLMERFLNGAPTSLAGLPASFETEFNMLRVWYSEKVAEGWVVHRTEWVIYTDEVYDLAGSVDCVLYHAGRDEYMIVDWKRCDITRYFETAFKNAKLLPPMDAVPASKRAHWKLQVNLYRHMLTKYYGLRVAGMCMVVSHAATNTTGVAVEIWHEEMDVTPLMELARASGADASASAPA